ncbi:MAG: hypothetical protein ACJ786_22975, partial [Catenulispora sp.]
MAAVLADEVRAPEIEDVPSPAGGRWLLPLGAALLLGVFIPLAYAALSGNLGIPHNDTWAFGRSAQEFTRTGHIRMFNWNMMGLAGLVVLAAPVGASLAAQSVLVAGLAVLGLAACFDVLAGALGADDPDPARGRRRAAVGTLVVALWPGFALLSTSFMTDVPAFAAVAGTLALGRRALDRVSLPWLAAACLVGLWGATVREQVLAAPAAVLAVALFRSGFRANRGRPGFRLTHLLGAGVLLLVAIGVFELWRRGVPGGGAPDFTVHKVTRRFVFAALMQALLIVALTVSPVVFAVVRPRAWTRPAWTAAGITLAATLLAAWDDGAFLGNYVSRDGAYSSASAYPSARAGAFGRPVLLGRGWWAVLAWTACFSAALLIGYAVQRVVSDGWGLGLPPEILLFAAVTTLGTLMEVVRGRDIYDRYLIPLAIPALALLLTGPFPALRELRTGVRSGLRAGAVALAAGMVAVTGAALMTNAFAFDTA